jgi:transposase-like protein
MARTGNIEAIAHERGVSTEELVTAAIEKHGSILRAAMALEVAPNTIRYWLNKHNLEVTQRPVIRKAQ